MCWGCWGDVFWMFRSDLRYGRWKNMLKLCRWRHLGRRGRVLSIDGEISVRDTGQKESTRLKVTGKKDNIFFSFLSRKTNKQINQKNKKNKNSPRPHLRFPVVVFIIQWIPWILACFLSFFFCLISSLSVALFYSPTILRVGKVCLNISKSLCNTDHPTSNAQDIRAWSSPLPSPSHPSLPPNGLAIKAF